MYYARHILFLLLLLTSRVTVLSSSSFTEFTDALGQHHWYYLKNITLGDNSCFTFKLCEDSQGMIWASTNAGLFSYDGYSFRSYPDTKPCGTIFSLCVAGDYILFGNDDGVYVFDLRQEKIKENWGCPSVGEVRCLYEYQGKVWFGTKEKGLLSWNPATNELKVECPKIKEKVYSIVEVHGTLYLATTVGLYSYRPDKGNEIKSIAVPGVWKNVFVNSLYYDADLRCIWGGLEKTPFCYHLDTGIVECLKGLPMTTYKTILRYNDDILFGTDNGLVVYHLKDKTHDVMVHDPRNSKSLSSNIVWDIFQDKKNNIWMGTDLGISFLSKNSFMTDVSILNFTHSESKGNLFTVLFSDSRQRLWLGGVNGLILLEKEKNGHYRDTWFQSNDDRNWISHNRVRFIFEDKDRIIWIATDGSILRYDEQTRRMEQILITDSTGRFNTDWAYSIEEDNNRNLWIATYGSGLFIINKDNLLEAKAKHMPYKAKYHFQSAQDGSPNVGDNVYFTVKDKDGYIWSSSDNGRKICRIHQESFKTDYISVNHYLSNRFDRISHLLSDSEGNVWFTAGGSMGKIDGKTLQVTMVDNSWLPEKTIDSFGCVNETIWFSTVDGIFVVDRHSLAVNCVANLQSQFQSFLYLPKEKIIMFGGNDALLCIDRNQNYSNRKYRDSIYVSALYNDSRLLIPGKDYNGGSSRFMRHFRLSSGMNNLTIAFSDFSYNSEAESYSYRLKGLNDDKWINLKAGDNKIDLRFLKYGMYRLQLRKGLTDRNSIFEYTIEIEAPWYLSTLAYWTYFILLISAICLLVFLLYRANNRKIQRMKQKQYLQLSKMKMDFFTNMAHELKTPLTLIIAPLSRLMAEVDDEKTKGSLQLIHENAQNLNVLIHKILDFKRMEYNDDDGIVRSHIELVSAIRKIVDGYQNSMQYGDIQFIFTCELTSLWVEMDYIKLNSILTNLISNAIRFVDKEKGRIEVKLAVNEKQFVIKVQDNGCGISHQEKKLVFLRLYQASNNADKQEGTGIGLYLVKKYVELHGGVVEMDSQENQGTTFRLTFPRSLEIHHEKEHGDRVYHRNSRRPKVLIVDDNREILDFLSATLSGNYDCLQANDGEEAFERTIQEQPNLIITDEMMPGVSGLQLSRLIRKDPRTKLIPIIMLTAKDERETELESMKIGIDCFISKPFEIDRLTLKIEQLIHQCEELDHIVKLNQVAEPIVQKEPGELSYDEKFLSKLSIIVEEQLSNTEFNVTRLSEAMGVEQKQLYRKLKALTGTTPVQFIRQIRMKKAAAILESQKFTISEVMYMVGFCNPAYFAECFQKAYGMSPKEYMHKAADSQQTV